MVARAGRYRRGRSWPGTPRPGVLGVRCVGVPLALPARLLDPEELLLVLILALVAQATPPAAPPVRWAALGLVLVSLYLLPGVLYLLPDVGGHLAAFRLPAVFAAQALLVGLVWAQWLSVPRPQCPAASGLRKRVSQASRWARWS